MKSKAFLYVAMILNLLYAIAMIFIFAGQSILFELSLTDIQDVRIYPLYDIAETVCLFVVVSVISILLKKNTECEGNHIEMIGIIVIMVIMILSPLCSIFGRAVTVRVYSVTQGVNFVAAYSVLQSYSRFVDILVRGAMVFLLVYACITYGRKYSYVKNA